MTRLKGVFALNRKGFNAARELELLWVLSVPWVVLVEHVTGILLRLASLDLPASESSGVI